MACAAIVVGQRAERGDRRTAQHEFSIVERVGDQSALGAGKQYLAAGSLHADVPTANGDDAVDRLHRSRGLLGAGDDGLAECQLIAGYRPIGRLGETLGYLQHQFGRAVAVQIQRPVDIELLRRTGRHVETAFGLPYRFAIRKDTQHERVFASGGEQIIVLDGHGILGDIDMHVGIQLLDLLGLRRGLTVRKHQAVAGELVVARPVAEVAAIAKARGSIGLGGVDRLVDEVPDEAALVLRIAFERGVFVHVAARIAHGVHVLAGDVRLLRIILQVFLDGVGVRIHAGLDVGHVVVVAVVGHALIVHGTVRVDVVHALVHGAEHVARVGFVAERPDQDARMVVVAAHHAVDTVDARALPMRLASRDGGLLGEDVTGQAPAAMGFEVGLVDQVDAVLVAQLVPALLVRIVGGPDGVEVVPLAEDHIVDHVLLGDRAAALGIELVAVGALEYDALAINRHDAVLDAEAAESDLLDGDLGDVAGMVDDRDLELVEDRILRAPRADAVQRSGGDGGIGVSAVRGLPDDVTIGILQRRRDRGRVGCVAHGERRVQRGAAGLRIPIGFDLHVLDMHMRLRGQLDRAEQSVQTPEVLVLEP